MTQRRAGDMPVRISEGINDEIASKNPGVGENREIIRIFAPILQENHDAWIYERNTL